MIILSPKAKETLPLLPSVKKSRVTGGGAPPIDETEENLTGANEVNEGKASRDKPRTTQMNASILRCRHYLL